MLTLIGFPPGLGMRSPSSFVVKADALLAMSGLDYRYEFGDVRKSPKAKFPVLRDGNQLICDSSHIQAYLETHKNIQFDAHLNKEEKAISMAFQRLIEEHLYFILVYFRWKETGDSIRDVFFKDVPKLLRGFVFNMVRKKLLNTVYNQGLGRHSRDELLAFAKQDIDALATFLGDKKFFHGDRASSIDASLFGLLHCLFASTLQNPATEIARQYPALEDYTNRFEKTFMPPLADKKSAS